VTVTAIASRQFTVAADPEGIRSRAHLSALARHSEDASGSMRKVFAYRSAPGADRGSTSAAMGARRLRRTEPSRSAKRGGAAVSAGQGRHQDQKSSGGPRPAATGADGTEGTAREHATGAGDLLFCTATGQPLDAANVRRFFRAVCTTAGIGPSWTPRVPARLRHLSGFLSCGGRPRPRLALCILRKTDSKRFVQDGMNGSSSLAALGWPCGSSEQNMEQVAESAPPTTIRHRPWTARRTTRSVTGDASRQRTF
jgi:hypothetical protein